MPFAVQRLSEDLRQALHEHFLALHADDRRFRFGTMLSSVALAAYVDRIDLVHDAVFCVLDAESAIVAALHLAFEDDRAEAGLSVLSAHRRRGIGSALFRRSMAHARIHGATEIAMDCLSANAPIMYFAQKFGMSIFVRGIEAEARLKLTPISLMSIVTEIHSERAYAQ